MNFSANSAKLSIISNNLLKEYEKNHPFKGWPLIRKLLLQYSEQNEKLGSSKFNLMRTLKNYMFIMESDYENNSYNFEISGISIENLNFWIKDRNMDPKKIFQNENGMTTFSIPYLHKLNRIQMKELKKSLIQIIDKETKMTEFSNELYRYVKCLSKRKSDFIIKIQGRNQNSENKRSKNPKISDLVSYEDEFKEEEKIRFSTQNDELIEEPSSNLPMEYLTQEMIVEYQKYHPFQNWNEIVTALQTFKNNSLDVTKKQLMHALKNDWFIESSDSIAPNNTICYKVEPNIDLEPNWNYFARISNDQLEISIPNLFIQTREIKSIVKQWLAALEISNYELCPIDSRYPLMEEHKIDSLLTLYLKRLSKRKHDFITSILQKAAMRAQQEEDYSDEPIPTPVYQPYQPIIFGYIIPQPFILILNQPNSS